MKEFRYVFGPIASRRLGRSLGISPIPEKVCNFSCIYCQIGRTNHMTNTRKEYYKTEDIIAEFKEYLADSDQFDIVTVCGEGEPTLASNMGEIIIGLKKLTEKPVAVITNGALLYDPQVRKELSYADLVLPSLDAGDACTARTIDRPHGHLDYEKSYQGLVDFTHEYQGEIWMELMLIDGINDSDEAIAAFRSKLEKLRYDRLYINTPVRPPAEANVNVITKERMAYAVEQLGGINLDIMASAGFFSEIQDSMEAVKSMIKRHPMSQFEIAGFLKSRNEASEEFLERLCQDEEVEVIDYKGILSFRLKHTRG